MDRKEKIFEFIKSKEYIPLKIDEMKSVLAVPQEDIAEFERILDELLAEGKIFLTKKKRYEAVSNASMVTGTLQCNAYGYFAFLIPSEEGEEELFIGGDKMGNAYDGDLVICAIDVKGSASGKREGHVVKILKRGNERLCGIVRNHKSGEYRVYPDSRKIYTSVRVANEDMMDAVVGNRVLVEITDYADDGKMVGKVVKNLGSSDDLKSNIGSLISEHSVKQEFDEDTLDEAKNTPKRVSQKEIAKRLDLRDKIIFTIDGDDARDFDDAVSLERTEDGRYLLGVHIADVTEYVRPDTALDKEAFLRGTSVYLSDRVIPMLPFELSNGICSLNPNVNRLTLSVFMKIDKNGGIDLDSITKSVIRSCERLTYNNVADLLEKHDGKLMRKYKYIFPILEDMYELSKILNSKREKRGSINFDFPEARVIVNAAGEPVDIKKEERRISHKMIEEFMLAANETVAEFAFWAELPFIYRVHEAPTVEKTEDFNRFLANLGYGIKGKFDKDTPIHPKAFQQVLDKIKGTDEEEMISTYMLRSLMKAEYKSENLGHFGLAAKYYCHFTSPIRRYPDLFIHRVLKAYIDAKETDGFFAIAGEAAKNSSKTEREAELLERDVDDLMKTAYMSQFIGGEFSGIVSSVTNFGMFLQLENTVEGLIRLEDMKDDYYEYDDNLKKITGKRKGNSYKIGDRLDAVLVKCDCLTRRMDFVRAEDYGYDTLEKFNKNSNINRKEKIPKHKTKKRKTNKKPKMKKRKKNGKI